ncbi:hypothetical protein ACIBG0_36410 [Nocardia sp. NPDC050630]|uniref:hypothetical protein n=1 Tax=Nocardia sp. NPDC050630 TaxID=3364321 RepID=UPI0037934D37
MSEPVIHLSKPIIDSSEPAIHSSEPIIDLSPQTSEPVFDFGPQTADLLDNRSMVALHLRAQRGEVGRTTRFAFNSACCIVTTDISVSRLLTRTSNGAGIRHPSNNYEPAFQSG